ncbi:Cnl2/NKP2 family protein-domain-containing protein [Triangularia verruculosa]|uniref:Cnl2/NKP2 family protein-domain-containing protein n=1 Tax=Triangularia verruculosa TaxID=2587418 RepID=A0AAN7AZ57_9PEZI|nr:Cnl2/NKP2 family protein-domain-containing protein [Triangularia verruculosa]
MAPTEQAILSNYLLIPAQLPAIISLEEFTGFFPRQLQASPHLRSLYRDLQSQRNAVVDAVAEEIQAEARQGRALRRHVMKARREAEAQEQDDELDIERMLGTLPDSQNPKHGLQSILPSLEDAISELESQLQLIQSEEASLLSSVQKTVGDLSDLRYGRLANPKLPEQVLEGLQGLQETCKEKQ